MEIDVWDGQPPSSSSSENEAAHVGVPKEKKPKSELSLRKRLELRFGRKGSDEKVKDSSPPKDGEERIKPWKSHSSSYRAEPRVLHGMVPPFTLPPLQSIPFLTCKIVNALKVIH